MHRGDLYLEILDLDGDALTVTFDTDHTYLGIVDSVEAATVALDDTDVRRLRDHLTTLLETRK